MGALTAALGCSFMMILALGAFAWYVRRPHRWRGESSEAEALRSELAALRQRQSDASSDKFSGRA